MYSDIYAFAGISQNMLLKGGVDACKYEGWLLVIIIAPYFKSHKKVQQFAVAKNRIYIDLQIQKHRKA